MNPAQTQVVIAGAGIIGLTVALELAGAGFEVTVAERGRAMEQSSWAAAGMLAVDDPENAPELLPLARLSRALYPEFLARIEQLSGLSVPLRTRQTLQGHAFLENANSDTNSDMVPPPLPGLSTAQHRFTLLEEASLDPRDLCAALPLAACAAGVQLLEENAVCAVERGGSSLAVTLAGGSVITADAFVIAAGAWSGSAGHRTSLPVAPCKGQMIEVTLDGPELPMVIRTPELYLVPRGDGRVAIGATVEYAGFDRGIDEAAGDRLWEAAAALWPPVRKGRITARWTGLRPGFRPELSDTLPVIGQLEDKIWAATGHFRNGILLAPGTARLVREMLTGQAASIPMEAFRPSRFSL